MIKEPERQIHLREVQGDSGRRIFAAVPHPFVTLSF